MITGWLGRRIRHMRWDVSDDKLPISVLVALILALNLLIDQVER